jgi:UDP-3-O-[3-hydroxymyristoyl] glucosamine N-acyltransferase
MGQLKACVAVVNEDISIEPGETKPLSKSKRRFSYVSSFRDVCTPYACISVDIHPTAVVDPTAVIGSGAIGACCYIGPDVNRC